MVPDGTVGKLRARNRPPSHRDGYNRRGLLDTVEGSLLHDHEGLDRVASVRPLDARRGQAPARWSVATLAA